jgi:tryptophan 2,3-dioxygenase
VHQAHELYMKLIEHELRFTGKHSDLLLHGMKAAKGHDPGCHG